MQMRKCMREFKLEAVRLVQERGVSVEQAGRNLDLHGNVLRFGGLSTCKVNYLPI